MLGIAAVMADSTIYVTGPCAVTVYGNVATVTPTATPVFGATATPTVPPTPTPAGTLTPTPALTPLAQVQALMMAKFPKYDSDGSLLTNPVYYSFGDCLAPIRSALAAGQTPLEVTQALSTIWSRYATTYVPPGPGGPGGNSGSLAWGQATGEAGYSQCQNALFPPSMPTPASKGTPTPAPTAGAGPGVG